MGKVVRVGQVGSGGLGEVYRYHDVDLDRDVALKLAHAHVMRDPASVARFERECRITGSLNHPGIVPVHGRGSCNDGRPFYVMSFVDGKTLRECVHEFHAGSKSRLSRDDEGFRRLLDSLASVCQAIDHAHQHGVCHRDLKPDNIVVREDGVTVVVDWGLAKLEDRKDEEPNGRPPNDPQVTHESEIVGTPAYMAPEQAAGRGASADHLTDIYCLGAVLFEIVTNTAPHLADEQIHDRRKQIEQLRVVVAQGDAPRARRRNPAVPNELDSVCAKSMAKDPLQRYQHPSELADDVERWLVQSEVQAHRYTLGERLVRYVRRHARALAWLAASLVILSAGLAFAAFQSRTARLATREALTREEVRRVQLAGLLSKSALDNGDLINVRSLTGNGWDSWEQKFLSTFGRRRPVLVAAFGDGNWGISAAALSPDGTKMVAAYNSGAVALWDVESGTKIRDLLRGRYSKEKRRWLHHLDRDAGKLRLLEWEACCCSLIWLGKTDNVVAASLNGEGLLIDTTTGDRTVLLTEQEPLTSVAASEDGANLLFGGNEGSLFLCRNRMLSTRTEPNADPVTVIRPLGDDSWLVGRNSGTVEIREAETLRVLGTVTLKGPIWSVDVARTASPPRVAVSGGDSRVRLFEIADSGKLLLRQQLRAPATQGRRSVFHVVRFADDLNRVFAIDDSGVLIAWDASEGMPVVTHLAVMQHHGKLQLLLGLSSQSRDVPLALRRRGSAIIISADSKTVFTAGEDALVKQWFVPPPETGRRILRHVAGASPAIAFAPGSLGQLWVLDMNGRLIVIRAETGEQVAQVNAHAGGVGLVTDGDTVITAGGDGRIRFWRLRNKRIVPDHIKQITHNEPLRGVAVDPLRRWVAAVDDTAQLLLWDYETGSLFYQNRIPSPEPGTPYTGKLAFSPNGRHVAAFGAEATGIIVRLHRNSSFVKVKPDQLRISGKGGTAMIWNPLFPSQLVASDTHPRVTPRWVDRSPLPGWSLGVQVGDICAAMTTTKDSRRMVFLEVDGLLRFIDTKFGYEMLRLQSSMGEVCDLAFEDTNRWLAVAGTDGSIELWDAGGPNTQESRPARVTLENWKSKTLLTTRRLLRICERAVRIDSQDRIALAGVRLRGTRDRLGEAFFVREEAEGGDFKVILLDDSYNNRVSGTSVALEIGPRDEPVVVLRRLVGEVSPYDGMISMGKRTPLGDWEFRTIRQHGNSGFYPVLVQRDGQVVEILHFSFDGFYLKRSRPTDGQEWSEETIGRQGDGMILQSRTDPHGALHLLFTTNRVNGFPGGTHYVRWNADLGDWQPEAVSSSSYAHSLDLLSDGTPVVLKNVVNIETLQGSDRWMRRTVTGWRTHQILPANIRRLGMPAIGPDDTTFIVAYRKQDNAVSLWTGRKDKWTESLIATGFQGTPDWSAIRFDGRGLPVIVLVNGKTIPCWIQVLRPRHWRKVNQR